MKSLLAMLLMLPGTAVLAAAQQSVVEVTNPTTPRDDAKPNSDQVPEAYAISGQFERIVVLRFKRQTDLLAGIEKTVKEQKIRNAVFLSGIGSVRNYHVPQSSAPGPVAPPKLELAIRLLETRLFFGDEIPVEFTITNRGRREYEYSDRHYDRSGRMEEYALWATDASGHRVPDPRAKMLVVEMGGLAGLGRLAPGASFRRTVALNRWALISGPGRFTVMGRYRTELGEPIEAGPVKVEVRPRSQADLDALVDQLAARLRRAPDAETHGQVAQKLMFTHSPRILPILIESMYGRHSGFWEGEALVYYLAHVPERERKAAVLRVATQRGLASNMQFVLASLGVTAAEIQPVIERSLEPANRAAWAHGALAAQIYGHDRFTARLVALASDPTSGAQHQAMSALALNRNDEAIRTLKGLLAGPDAQSRRLAEEAIRTAYVYRGAAHGRPLHPDDFDRSLQQPAPSR